MSAPSLDPQTQAFIDEVAAAGVPPIETMRPSDVRALQGRFVARLAGTVEAVKAVTDRAFPGPGGPIPIRIYQPHGPGPFGVLVWFHGGGWTIGSLETADAACRALSRRTPCIVVSVAYRLAPEHRFPAAFEDAAAALQWVVESAASIGGDASRLAVGGDSSGGTLAAAVAIAAAERGSLALRFALLVYPATDDRFDRPSCKEFGNGGYFITLGEMRWYWKNYLASPADAQSPYACPLRAPSLRDFPPALFIVAECDPLRDGGLEFAARLRDAGVTVDVKRYAGMIHGFFTMPGVIDRARGAYADAAAALERAIGSPKS